MRLLPICLCISLSACATDGTRPSPQIPAESLPRSTSTTTGFVLTPEEGKKLVFCSAPGLGATVKSTNVSMGGTVVAIGTAEINHGSNIGVHQDEDEIVFIHSGRGSVVLNEQAIPAAPGTIMYVPRGVRHGFVNTGDAPFEFFWLVAPPGLANRFLASGKSSLTDCPTP